MDNLLKDPEISKDLISTGILIAVILLARYFTIQALRRSSVHSDTKRQWIVQAKNTTIILLFLGLLFVWGSELRTFAISIVAIAAAVVIGTKELILCLLGGILKTLTRPFKVGDRIELNMPVVVRGDVISHSLLTTTLFEIGPGRSAHQYTGKTISIPNSLYLSLPIYNESKSSKYGLHTFSVFRPNTVDVGRHQNLLLKAAETTCSQYTQRAQHYLNEIGEVEGVESPTADPRVFISLQNAENVEFIVRVPVESLRAGRTEQAILQLYLDQAPE